ncbi:glycosyltransferase family 39 protein [Paludisphaera mucosa]|uniref:Glycosyltransferase family 39 protein n=1 Tax=Paludisphaera mucosa TaxID=3030827 RepID=A0ABT6F7C9_9BACT|nr:glycosyltransferase family 39 protein [Paludisphaera mucosa]MDG3003501.1 glycosyltransferase family 39 protein [Paludisphaera mucosa]
MEPETTSQTRRSGEPASVAPSRSRPRRRIIASRGESTSTQVTFGPADPRLLNRGVWAFIALGVVVRMLRYAQNLPFWSDECFLAVNFIRRGFLELAGPLDNGQVCPLAFLWIERAAVLAMGFSEWSLRLFPLLCGMTSVVLFERVARRCLSGLSLQAAVAILAVSVHPIRHAAEAKPYASDLLVGLVLLAPAAAWLDHREGPRRLWILFCLLPPAVAVSNPAVFVAGGILVALFWPVWRSGRWKDRGALTCCGLLLLGLFAIFHVGFGGVQSAAALDGLRRYWGPGFPPLEDPLNLPDWMLSALTGSVFAYPGGGARGASAATFIACIAGSVTLIRRGRGAMVVALTAPLGLNLIAAAVQRYPFGPEARLAQYAAPGIVLLAGAGVGSLLETVRRSRLREALIYAGVVGLVACALAPQIMSWRRPYRMLHDREARDFARSFWPEVSRGSVVACAHLDFGLGRPGAWEGRRAWYLCNQAVASPRRRASGGPRLDEVSSDRPLRCVVFDEEPSDPEVIAWLARMRRDFQLRSTRSVPVRSTYGDDLRSIVETWRIYEFTPASLRVADPVAIQGDLER